jgi:crotonobetainyl-CoA:carnitine CoA-transferase CaiB-like acyl-CoA transferase
MRDQGGENLVFDVATMEVMASVHQFTFSTYAATGQTLRRKRRASQVCPMDVFECADGWVAVGVVTDAQYDAFASAVGAVELVTDPRFSDHRSRIEHRSGFDAIVDPWFMSHSVDCVVRELQQRQVPAVRAEDVHSINDAPQLRSRDFWMEQSLDGELGVVPGDPIRILTSDTAGGFTTRPARTRAPAGDGEGQGPLPLSDLVVVDATQYWAGPLATRILADLGATVVKIERPGSRMHVHNIGPASDWKMNRGKLSLAVDLASEDGREIVRDLARHSQVVVENFRPGVMTRLGLGFEQLSAGRSDLVYLSLSGFGQTGPQAPWLSYGPLLEAASSIQSRTRYPDGPPTPLGHSLPDAVGGLTGAFAVLNALRRNRDDGLSRHIDLSQLESYTAISGEEILAASAGRAAPPQSRYAYRCQGQDEWIVIEADGEEDLLRLGRTLGCALDSPDYVGRLEERTGGYDKHELARLLQREGIAAFAVLNAADLTQDPGLTDRGFLVEVEIGGKPVRLPGFPFRANARVVSLDRPAPIPGAHSEAVLRQMLGYDDARVQYLFDAGVVGAAPAGAPANPRAISHT